MKKQYRPLNKMNELNKREILSNQVALNRIEKKIDNKIIANGK
jgi:Fur-regulated basic protein B